MKSAVQSKEIPCVLVLNNGSSSIKGALYQVLDKASSMSKGKASFLKLAAFKQSLTKAEAADLKKRKERARKCIDSLVEKDKNASRKIIVVAHRVVHGGEMDAPCLIDSKVLKKIKDLCEFAPLHNPGSLAVIEACREALPAVRQVACFDTAFHRSIKSSEAIYALPAALTQKYKLQRYGFHGINCAYITDKVKNFSLSIYGSGSGSGRHSKHLLICHLGAGASVTAVKDGKSVDNSMGFTPLDGLVMNTRAGHIDAGVVLYLMGKEKLSVPKMEELLNKDCGLMGLCGESDMRKIEEAAFGKIKNKSTQKALETLDLYHHRLRTVAGAMIASMGGLDTLVFTGGIGENSAAVRERLGADLAYLGLKLSASKNKSARAEKNELISTNASKVKVYVMAADEELEMASSALRV